MPLETEAPVEDSEGTRPTKDMNALAEPKRERSPRCRRKDILWWYL